MLITLSTKEVAKIIGMDRHNVTLLSELGVLQGIRTGQGWRFAETDIERFWEEYKGEDLSNPEKIRIAAALHRIKKGGEH